MTQLIYRSPENPYSHHTAIARAEASFPARHLFRNGLITGRVLDFGCGQGADVRFLQQAGIDVTGYDPHFSPTVPTGRFDTILCTYVLNVLLPVEQSHVLMAVSELLGPQGQGFFAVRRDVERSGFRRHAIYGTQVYQCRVRLPYPSHLRTRHCEIYTYRPLGFSRKASGDCGFCHPSDQMDLITESAMAYSIRCRDTQALEALIVPKVHGPTIDALPGRVRTAVKIVMQRTHDILDTGHPADSWAVTRREGTGIHAHLHLAHLEDSTLDLCPHGRRRQEYCPICDPDGYRRNFGDWAND